MPGLGQQVGGGLLARVVVQESSDLRRAGVRTEATRQPGRRDGDSPRMLEARPGQPLRHECVCSGAIDHATS